jgi:regulator of protease activity HflC (stomatin/prohibitin superfamily)
LRIPKRSTIRATTLVPLAAALASALAGCATVQPGHRGLYFSGAGLDHEPLMPGRHWVGLLARVEDVDVTYSTRGEEIHTTSAEGLSLDLKIEVIYRPIISELYELETEVGLNYYEEVIGPEFRSAARGVFARRSYLELLKRNEQIEDEIETDLRRRIERKHVEVTSITIESIKYAPEIARAVEEKLAAEQDAARQKTLLENEAMRRKLELEQQAEQARIKLEASMREKTQEAELAKVQAAVDKLREQSEAEKRVIRAKADADAAKFEALAKAEEARAVNQALTPLSVMARGYEALENIGKSPGTHIMLGDWSKVPNFLLPPGIGTTFRPPSAQ